jgi:tetratricopeptide (TPR) repeat protein
MKALESVVLFSVNAEDSLGAPLAATHAVRNYPTWVLMDAGGGIVDRWLGYEKTDFLETLAEGVADPVPIDQRLARFQAKPTAADAARLARYQASRREYREGVRLYREAQRLDPSASRDFSEPIFDLMTRGLADSLFTPDELLSGAQDVLASPRRTPRSLLDMASALQRAAASLGDRTFGANAVQAACDATADATDPELTTLRNGVLADQTLFVLHDPSAAVALKRAAMPAGWMGRATDLNEFCWWCFEGATNLEEAEALARQALGLAQPGGERANVLDTLAEIAAARGDPREAVTLTEQAIADDPKSTYYPKQLEKFKRLVITGA